MVDAGDSKSPAFAGVPVRVRPWVPMFHWDILHVSRVWEAAPCLTPTSDSHMVTFRGVAVRPWREACGSLLSDISRPFRGSDQSRPGSPNPKPPPLQVRRRPVSEDREASIGRVCRRTSKRDRRACHVTLGTLSLPCHTKRVPRASWPGHGCYQALTPRRHFAASWGSKSESCCLPFRR